MALDKFGLNSIGHLGMVDGVHRKLVGYATNDTAAVIETDGYFDAVATQFNEGAGDVLIVAGDLDGTPFSRTYLVTRISGDIALTLSTATAAA